MLNVTLNASNQLAVETTSDVIRLMVAPGAYDATSRTYDLSVVTFDPAQPYAVLNGTAYSRVLGWYDQGRPGPTATTFTTPTPRNSTATTCGLRRPAVPPN